MEPQKRYLKRYQAKLEEMDKLISGATLELESLRSQSVVLRLKNKRLLEALQEKAARQENELKQKLEKERKIIEAEITELSNKQAKLVVENNSISTKISDQYIQKQTMDSEIAELKVVEDTLNKTILEYKRQIDVLATELKANTSIKEELNRDILSLENQKSGLLKHIEVITAEKSDIDVQVAQATKDYELKKEDYTKKILEIDGQLMRKIEMLKEVSKKDQQMREEIAKQRSELERREEVLRRRELIVGTGEQKLKDNVSMLQL